MGRPIRGMPLVRHDHVPLYRVARAGWSDPVDATFSTVHGGRWSPRGGFPILYTCCSKNTARAVLAHVLRVTSLEIDDLNPEIRPVLVEVEWSGDVVDMCSVEGVMECGFRIAYPAGYTHEHTQQFGTVWHSLGAEGVVCRSESVFQNRHHGWLGDHREWSEVAIFVGNAQRRPRLVALDPEFDWFVVD